MTQQIITLSERQVQLAQLVDSPEVGPVTKNVARQLSAVASELLDRVMRTFDQVRDPTTLLVDMEAAIAEVESQQPPQELEAIAQMIGQGLDGAEQGAAQGVIAANGAAPAVDEATAVAPGLFSGL